MAMKCSHKRTQFGGHCIRTRDRGHDPETLDKRYTRPPVSSIGGYWSCVCASAWVSVCARTCLPACSSCQKYHQTCWATDSMCTLCVISQIFWLNGHFVTSTARPLKFRCGLWFRGFGGLSVILIIYHGQKANAWRDKDYSIGCCCCCDDVLHMLLEYKEI